jgi:uncharacterized protein involved in exopolysaccharide biosynthesis/Mrp family chromosome partitioning ATPase
MNQNLGPRRGFGADFYGEAPARAGSEEALAELLLALRRQVWTLGLGAMVGLILGVMHYATTPKTFEAAATLLIEEKQTDLEQELAAVLPASRSDTSMRNEMQVLRSLEVATSVVQTLDLQNNPDFLSPPSSVLSTWIRDARSAVRSLIPTPEAPSTGPVDEAVAAHERLLQAAQSLRNRTGFQRVDRSFVVEIWFASHDRALAADIVNAYADAYIADGITANLAASERTAHWMEARLEELRRDALAAAQEAERFRLAVGAADQQGLRDLEQRAEALNDLVLRFQSRYRELTLESTYPMSAGRVLSRALPPRDAAAPRAWQFLAAGLLLGLMMGTAVAVLREAREKGFRTSGDVTRTLGLPFVGYVPRPRNRMLAAIVGRGARSLSAAAARKRPARGALPSRHLAEPGHGTTSDEALPDTGGNWTFARDLAEPVTARAIRGVFASLDAGHDDRTGRLVAVGALGSGEGATHLAAHLGFVAAQAGRRCLLSDGDLATGALSRRVGLVGAPGILDVLDGTADLGAALAQRPASDLDVLPVGTGRERDAWFSYMAELGELFVDLRESYDYIFVDLPPLAETPEVKSILRRTDALLLATAWGRTPRKLTRTCLENDPDLRQSVFGVVLTRARVGRLPRYGVPVPYGARRRWWPTL